ncbi:hypothetical protein LIA77_09074 [Sarocladium implicatum]|nr:hypothetical protein LIA77_09074 [Sarocladium implicatum]
MLINILQLSPRWARFTCGYACKHSESIVTTLPSFRTGTLKIRPAQLAKTRTLSRNGAVFSGSLTPADPDARPPAFSDWNLYSSLMIDGLAGWTKRLGFAQLPAACDLARHCRNFMYAKMLSDDNEHILRGHKQMSLFFYVVVVYKSDSTDIMKLLSLSILPCLATALSPVMRAEEGNWETYTNELGYTTVRFKEGMEPGSDDYSARLGGNNTEAVIEKRQDGWTTEPLVGSTKIPYGCDVNVRDGILSKLWDICSELGCDSGTTANADVDWSDDGLARTAQVSFKATGRWPSGMQEPMIHAIQAEVPYEAVEVHEKTTRGGGNTFLKHSLTLFSPPRIHKCWASETSNFFSVVTRASDQGLVAQLDVEVWFTDICGTMGNAGNIIVGQINGIAGGIFGFVRELICAAR